MPSTCEWLILTDFQLACALHNGHPLINTSCLLCNQRDENKDHLFLRCPYSEQVWMLVTRRMVYSFLFYTWTSLIEWLDMKDSTCPLMLWCLVHCTINRLWIKRNARLNNTTSTTPPILFKGIDKLIRNAISARRGQQKFRNLMRLWFRFS